MRADEYAKVNGIPYKVSMEKITRKRERVKVLYAREEKLGVYS